MQSSVNSAELWPYSERNGVFVVDAIEGLLSAPETVLDETEKQQAYDFSRDLLNGFYDENLQVAIPKSLEAVSRTQTASHRQSFYTGYLDTPQGVAECTALLGSEPALTGQTMRALRELVAHGREVDDRARKLLAANSEKWYRQQMTERLLDDTVDAASAPDFEQDSIDFKPSILLEKCHDIQAYRTFYRAVKREVKQQTESPLTRAKQVLVDAHIAQANSMLAELYPGAVHLAQQLDASPETMLTEQWRQELFAVAPVISEAWKHNNKEAFAERFMERLDRLRNGVGQDDTFAISSISHELLSFAGHIQQTEIEMVQPSHELIDHLEQTKWQSPHAKALIEAVLEDWDWLSETKVEWQEVEERTQPASDGKWQVVISPKAISLSVNAAKKVVYIPEDFDRSLLQQNPSGVLPVVAHELTHVVQGEYDDMTAQRIPLAKIKGRRALTGREMGGVQQESIVLAHFNQTRNMNIGYLRALQAKLAGGNQTEVAKAYKEASHGKDAANTAAKVSRRLYRYQGYNTQPLDYLEQAVMLSELRKQMDDERIAAIAMASTSFSLHDSAALHAVDLLEVPTQALKNPAEDVLRIYFERFHESA